MYCNGVLIDKDFSYRIKNNAVESGFWYYFSSNAKELNSHCISEQKAEVYKGSFILTNIALIQGYKNAKPIQV